MQIRAGELQFAFDAAGRMLVIQHAVAPIDLESAERFLVELACFIAENKARVEGVSAANDWATQVGGTILAEATRRRGGLILMPNGRA